MPKSDVGLVAQAVAECAKLWHTYLKSKDRRRMAACIEAAESYIFVDEEGGEYDGIAMARKEKLKAHFRKRFFAYNQ